MRRIMTDGYWLLIILVALTAFLIFATKRKWVSMTKKNLSDDQFSFIRHLIDVAQSVIPTELDSNTIREEGFIRAIRLYLLLKYIRTLRSFILLIENHYIEDAIILLRTLCEIWVKYLHAEKNKPLSSFLLLRQEYIHGLKMFEKWRNSLEGKPPDDDMIKQRELIEKWKLVTEKIASYPELSKSARKDFEKFSGDNGKNIVENTNEYWIGKKTRRLLLDVDKNIGWVYGLGFEIPSALLHSNPGVRWYYLEDDGKFLKPRRTSDTENLDNFARFAAGWLIDIIEEYAKAESIQMQVSPESLRTQLFEVFPIRRKP